MGDAFRVASVVMLSAVLAVPVARGEESRARKRAELERLAADLERALGKGAVEMSGDSANAQQTARAVSVTEAIVAEMNRERVARGLVALRIDERLSLAASDRVKDMFGQHYFAHVAPDGTEPFVWVDRRGYRYRTVGENLAVGFREPQAIVSNWMRSPEHRANILGSAYREVGLAVAEGSPARGFRGPLVVALYGSR